jgi:Acyltransferase
LHCLTSSLMSKRHSLRPFGIFCDRIHLFLHHFQWQRPPALILLFTCFVVMRHHHRSLSQSLVLISLTTISVSYAFAPSLHQGSPVRHVVVDTKEGDHHLKRQHDWQLAVSMAEPPPDASFINTPFEPIKKAPASYMLTVQECRPLITIGKQDGKQKIINAYGLWCAVVSLVTAPFWFAAMFLLNNVAYKIPKLDKDWDPDRAIYDKTGKLWCKSWLTMIDSYPTCSGDVERLKESGGASPGKGPCLYVANHASWLDIPVICTVLDPVFKFIAKGELVTIPCIGQQLTGVSFFFCYWTGQKFKFAGSVVVVAVDVTLQAHISLFQKYSTGTSHFD